jgi:hypothetical protein
MQETMFVVPIPPLIAFGFLIGIVLFVLGYRETEGSLRRYHLMGLGIVVIGIMIPVTPLSWYGYWVLTAALVLGITELTIIAVAVILGVLLIYQGARVYARAQ